ncbi:MAG: N-acetylmuramoyl-L-alanine amidase, partial [Clostridium sp.]
MAKNFKNITAKLMVIFMISIMFNFNHTVESKAATNSSYENELLSIINKYGEENVIVGNGIVLETGENKELDNNNWVSNNEAIIKVEDNNLSAISEGTTFVVREDGGKAYIEEVQVATISPALLSDNERASSVDRNYYKVFLDPGHGGVDPGAVANGVREADLNLIISEKVKTKLQNKNVEVMTSRSSDATVELGDRAKMANSYGADTFVSIHQNSATASASGIETFYQETKTQYIPYASKIQNAIIGNTGAIDRGTKPEDFNVLRTSNMPSALVECGFITNSSDVSKLKTDRYREAIANAIADSIYSYLVENITLAPKEDGVAYSTHIQDYGWQNDRYNGKTSGTSGQGK